MRTQANVLRAAFGFLVVGLVASGCGERAAEGVVVESTTSPLSIKVLPTGTTCGLGYYKDGNTIVKGICNGASTLNPTRFQCSPLGAICISTGTSTPTPGAHLAADGDRGLGSGWGFYHQTFDASPGSGDVADSAFYALPSGTACGFKEACNDSGETCMGFNANVSCPSGWVRRVSSDLHAPSGCGFVWCEFQDVSQNCPDDCGLTTYWIPSGTVCGITDGDRNNGQCLGFSTLLGCPSGWTRYGFLDDGRPAGHGVGWCVKP
jgi:hypothetical protein